MGLIVVRSDSLWKCEFNEKNKIDYLSKYENEFSNFMENSRWKKFYKKNNDGYNKRITILCSDIGTKLITKR